MKTRTCFVLLAQSAIGLVAFSCATESPTSSFDDAQKDAGSTYSLAGFQPTPDGGSCQKLTCADLAINCGPAGDGCGGIIESCGNCLGSESCGGSGTWSVCGVPSCTPKTCAELGIECGPAGDGCGGVINCATCTAPATCGGGGPSKCGTATSGGPDGGGSSCTPRTTCAPGDCGPMADGCGGLVQCGTCTAPETCGGAGPSKCGAPKCTKTTCAAAGADCGFVADGCGGILDCGGPAACKTPGHICGGGGANKCGTGQSGPGPACINYCEDQKPNASCGATTTRITGKVFAPNGTLPLPDALVYVPNGSKSFPHGVTEYVDGVAAGTCEQCKDTASGSPLVSTRTAFDGSFTLPNVPAGTAFPLVIQLGRWRRMISVPAIAPCGSLALTAEQTRLPHRQGETSARDNIPLLGISTGKVDGLECVLFKLGIEQSQFTNPDGGGRIHFYRDMRSGMANGGALIDSNTPRTDNALTDEQTHLDRYDAVIFGCPGGEHPRADAIDDRVRAYANKGGRVFATHFNYVYLFDRAPWNATAQWDVPNAQSTGSGANATWVGEVNTSPGKRSLFAQWLGDPAVAALSASSPPRITITEARNNVDVPLATGAEEWITYYGDGASGKAATGAKPLLHYTFNTPWGAAPANQCGRVLFSDFHVTVGDTADQRFPTECGTPLSALTSQEKILAFFLFDLTSCIQPPVVVPPKCTPLTCAQQGIACGKAGDGCGNQLDCNPCPTGQVCQGSPAKCVKPACSPATCQSLSANCGFVADGCGASLDCGKCPDGSICGGAAPNQCGTKPCSPISCSAQQIACGPAGNGCGAIVDCGPCPAGQTCGGGGVHGQCGAPPCTKRTCTQANATCGFIADGCGAILDCGSCPTGEVCGGNNNPNACTGVRVK